MSEKFLEFICEACDIPVENVEPFKGICRGIDSFVTNKFLSSFVGKKKDKDKDKNEPK